mmetsp:Transcript_81832/g.227951  ORF Transcript_81832/g.227951 Transcript_81832/m.227951 type:complete len:243 (+) Transcript_81832:512-1240(+)
MQARGVSREAPVDGADVSGHFLETCEETFLPCLSHCLELRVDVLDLAPRRVSLVGRGLHVLDDRLHLIDGLQVRAQALQFYAQALQLAPILLFKHFGRGAAGRCLLLRRQCFEVDSNSRCGLVARRFLLRRCTRGLAGSLGDVLERLETTADQRHFDVFEDALAQDVSAGFVQLSALRGQIDCTFLERHELLSLLFAFVPQLRQRSLGLALCLGTLAGTGLHPLHLCGKGVGVLLERLLLRV